MACSEAKVCICGYQMLFAFCNGLTQKPRSCAFEQSRPVWALKEIISTHGALM